MAKPEAKLKTGLAVKSTDEASDDAFLKVNRGAVEISLYVLPIVLGVSCLIVAGLVDATGVTYSWVDRFQVVLRDLLVGLAVPLIAFPFVKLLVDRYVHNPLKNPRAYLNSIADGTIGLVKKKIEDPHGVSSVRYAHAEIDFKPLISNASHITVLTSYFDSIPHEAGEQVDRFWSRDGATMTLILPDVWQPSVVEDVVNQHEYRETYAANVKLRVERTVEALTAGMVGDRAQIWLVQHPLNFTGYQFDDILWFSPLPHAYRTGQLVPRVEVDLRKAPRFREFWERQIATLKSSKSRDQKLQPLGPLSVEEFRLHFTAEAASSLIET